MGGPPLKHRDNGFRIRNCWWPIPLLPLLARSPRLLHDKHKRRGRLRQSKMRPVLEDYYECLHHKKEAARTLALQAAYRKAEANIKRDDAPSAGEIRRLGVLDAPLEEKNLKPSKWFPHKEIN